MNIVAPRVGLLAWLTFATLAQPAAGGEVKMLKGEVHQGEIVSVSSTEVRVKTGDREVVLPVADVIAVELGAGPTRLTQPLPFVRVRLVDGSSYTCQTFGLASHQATLGLLNGIELKVPDTALEEVLCEAHEAANVEEHAALVARKSKSDVLRILARDGKSINVFEGVIGSASPAGDTLRFTPDGSDAVNVSLARVRGLIYSRPGDRPVPLARVHDQFQNVFAVQAIVPAPAGYRLTLLSGSTVELASAIIQRFDFSPGKLAYLSDLEPVRLSSTLLLADHLAPVQRDRNLERGTLSVGQRTYVKGLAVHSRTILEYDVAGYAYFRCVLGIDDAVAAGHAVVRIEADGKELFQAVVSTRDPAPRDLELKLDGAKRLKLTVDYGEDFDLGDHVIFADARVMK